MISLAVLVNDMDYSTAISQLIDWVSFMNETGVKLVEVNLPEGTMNRMFGGYAFRSMIDIAENGDVEE